MFVNAILHHEVPVFDEKSAKFFMGRCNDSSARLSAWQSATIDGYKISAYERPASARRHFREFTFESAGPCASTCEKRRDVRN